MINLMELGDSIAKLSGSEAKELRTLLKDRLGIEAPGGDAPPQVDVKEEVIVPVITDYNVMYTGFDLPKKIGLIKVLREINGMTLGDAKNFVEGTPRPVRENVSKNIADELKEKLEAAGAKIALVPA